MQQRGFHLRSSTRETKDLQVSKRANESFLAERDIYAYGVSAQPLHLVSLFLSYHSPFLSGYWSPRGLSVTLSGQRSPVLHLDTLSPPSGRCSR